MQEKPMKSLWDAQLVTQTAKENLIKTNLICYLDWKNVLCICCVKYCRGRDALCMRLSRAGFGYHDANHINYQFHLWFN